MSKPRLRAAEKRMVEERAKEMVQTLRPEMEAIEGMIRRVVDESGPYGLYVVTEAMNLMGREWFAAAELQFVLTEGPS